MGEDKGSGNDAQANEEGLNLKRGFQKTERVKWLPEFEEVERVERVDSLSLSAISVQGQH